MAGMYGADVDQLRALARSFDSAATRLDNDRLSVGNAIRINAWVGPVAVRFRADWDSAHSVKVAQAAARLHTAASVLRRNADDQERTSAVNGASAGGGGHSPQSRMSGPAESGRRLSQGPGAMVPSASLGALAMPGLAGAVGVFADGVRSTLEGAVKAVELPHAIGEYANRVAVVLMSGKGALAASELDRVMAVSKLGGFFEVTGKAIGGVSVALGVVDTISKASNGDTEGAILSGIKTGLGVAAFAPPPFGPIAAAAGIGITVGEILSENPAVSNFVTDVALGTGDAIARGATDVVSVVGNVADGVNKAAGSFLEGVGNTAKKLFPW